MAGMFSTVGPTAPIESRLPFRAPLILSSSPLETMKVSSDAVASGYVIINAADFDPAQHTAYTEPRVEKRAGKSSKGAE